MKSISVKKQELIQAIACLSHVGFRDTGWTWQVTLSPRAQLPDAMVELSHPGVSPDVSYTTTNTESYDPLAFADLNGFAWGDPDMLKGDTVDIKQIEQIRVDEDVRDMIETRLRKHVDLGGTTYSVKYY